MYNKGERHRPGELPTRRRGAVMRDFYTKPGVMTSAGRYAPLLEALPGDVTALTRVVQGLGVYDAVATDFYGFGVPEGREAEIHIRPVEGMLERLLELDDRPLSAPPTRGPAPGLPVPQLHAAPSDHAPGEGHPGAGPVRLRDLL